MNHPSSGPDVLLRITGPATDQHTVPVEVLTKLLDGMQQLAHLMGAVSSGVSIRRRFKPSEELRRESTLRCKIPVAGSYMIPMSAPPGHEQLRDSLFQLFDVVTSARRDLLDRLLPDSALRDRALLEMKKFFPKAGDSWGFALGKRGAREVCIDTRDIRTIERWLPDVMQIEAVDLSPIVLEHLQQGDRAFRLHPPLRMFPQLDESQQFLEGRDNDLDLVVYARNREHLVDELIENLVLLWDEYARDNPANLSEAAVRLRDRVLSRMKELPHAKG